MTEKKQQNEVAKILRQVTDTRLQPLDLLPHQSLVEKLVELAQQGSPPGPRTMVEGLRQLAEVINRQDSSDLNVVVFGGGTGLSNVIGGDSRNDDWPDSPFEGVKRFFPRTTAVVCITDDGGSTGELLKDLELIGLGDLRHVLLSSVQERLLGKKYGLGGTKALRAAATLHRLFNFRFEERPPSLEALCAKGPDLGSLPEEMTSFFYRLQAALFTEEPLCRLLDRRHCLGYLLLAAAIYLARQAGQTGQACAPDPPAIIAGIEAIAEAIGADPRAVLPCSTTPAQLKILYTNGVLVTGEFKSSQARRNCPVDRAYVEFCRQPDVPYPLLDKITAADLIVFAPGSLYTSIIPVLQVPGLADAVRANNKAVKILVANLWAQRGETDLVSDDPKRRFYVSDLIHAYQRNIPGGLRGLFREILALSLHDIKGSLLQNYAVEGKVPIYLDREQVVRQGFLPIEARIFSDQAMESRNVVQHDPAALARAIHTIWHTREFLPDIRPAAELEPEGSFTVHLHPQGLSPCSRFMRIQKQLAAMDCPDQVRQVSADILCRHLDILPEHLDLVTGISLVPRQNWRRRQDWDKIYAFYDPADRRIKIRQDVEPGSERFEIGFLVALGQSLLGNYAARKEMQPVERLGEALGKVFMLTMRPDKERESFFSRDQLHAYLLLARMVAAKHTPLFYTRLVNGGEGFTPPGLLFGLTYAWYLDNRFAAHIEYKMSICRTPLSDLIPEQLRTTERRRRLVDFFRETVFRHNRFL
ncbi:MAG: 2-phospho-L-lactate transferase CofD family protein [Deltaproteobacteria bacterium]